MAGEYASMLSKHAFFKGLRSEVVDLVAGCAQEIEFSAGQYICHEDDQADQFYVLVRGHVALQIASPGRGARTFLTIGAGEVFGVNWLVAPILMTGSITGGYIGARIARFIPAHWLRVLITLAGATFAIVDFIKVYG